VLHCLGTTSSPSPPFELPRPHRIENMCFADHLKRLIRREWTPLDAISCISRRGLVQCTAVPHDGCAFRGRGKFLSREYAFSSTVASTQCPRGIQTLALRILSSFCISKQGTAAYPRIVMALHTPTRNEHIYGQSGIHQILKSM
jgi:hypothetical protein